MKILTSIFNKSVEEKPLIYPFGSDECSKFLRDNYKDSIDETLILKEEFYEKLVEYDSIIKSIKMLEANKKEIEHLMQNEMKNYENAFCKDRKITWKKVVKNSVDTKKLKLENEDLVNKYMKTTTSRIFKIK